jgi:hypothetical protein
MAAYLVCNLLTEHTSKYAASCAPPAERATCFKSNAGVPYVAASAASMREAVSRATANSCCIGASHCTCMQRCGSQDTVSTQVWSMECMVCMVVHGVHGVHGGPWSAWCAWWSMECMVCMVVHGVHGVHGGPWSAWSAWWSMECMVVHGVHGVHGGPYMGWFIGFSTGCKLLVIQAL